MSEFQFNILLGGLWYYTPEIKEGRSCVMKSTVSNTSKEMMSYSDFPCPREFPMFMHNTYTLRYLHMYADKFRLKERIEFNTEVIYEQNSIDETNN